MYHHAGSNEQFAGHNLSNTVIRHLPCPLPSLIDVDQADELEILCLLCTLTL
jgi:hypothetical protein